MENFNGPIKYSAEGIVTNNSLQKAIVDFCVKVGVDPKYYGELFEEISMINSNTKSMLSKRPTFNSFTKKGEDFAPIFRKCSEKLVRIKSVSSFAQDHSHQSIEYLDQRNLNNLL